MEAAARRPPRTAVTTRSGPLTASPPANTPGSEVSPVSGLASMRPYLRVARRGVVSPMVGSGQYPRARMAVVAGGGEMGPWVGAGRAGVVGLAQLALQALHRAQPSVGAGDETHRLGEEAVLGALFASQLAILLSAGHLFLGSPIETGDLLGAHAQ